MFCLFQTSPTSKSTFSQQAQPSIQLYPFELGYLSDIDNLRAQILKGQLELIPQYLQLFHSQIKPLLFKIGFFHPGFSYKPLVSNFEVKITTTDCQEAFEIDHVMLVYSFCCHQLISCLDVFGRIRKQILEGNRPPPQDIDQIITKMKPAYFQLNFIQKDALTLLPKLSARKTFDVEEFSSAFFMRFRVYYIVMANTLHFEKEFELTRRKNLCSTMYKLIEQLGPLPHDRLGKFLRNAQVYFQGLCYKCILDNNLFNIEKENFKEKGFTILSLEVIQLCEELKMIAQFFDVKKEDEDYLEAIQLLSQRWIGFADQKIKIYSGIQKKVVPIQKNLQLLMECGYYNCLDC